MPSCLTNMYITGTSRIRFSFNYLYMINTYLPVKRFSDCESSSVRTDPNIRRWKAIAVPSHTICFGVVPHISQQKSPAGVSISCRNDCQARRR